MPGVQRGKGRGLAYLNTLNRYAKKRLGLYENMWAAQDQPLTSDERIQRAILTKYLYRLAIWGMHTQMWWYAYTSNDYMVQYNGNWFDPVSDLTILRYSAAGLPVAKARMQRLGDIFIDAKIVPARIAILQPQTSMLFQNYWKESFVEMEEMHSLLSSHNHRYELLPESYVTDGRAKLDDFDIVILPYAVYFPDRLGKLLGDWVKKGGTLLSCGPFGLYDKFGFDRTELWTQVFGARKPWRLNRAFPYWDQHRLWHWEMDGAKNDVVEQALGKGKVVVTLRSLRDRDFRNRMGFGLMFGFDKWARRPVRSTNGLETALLETSAGKKFLCIVNPNVDRPTSDTIILAGNYKSAVDVDVPGGFPVPLRNSGQEASFSLSIEPGGFSMIALE